MSSLTTMPLDVVDIILQELVPENILTNSGIPWVGEHNERVSTLMSLALVDGAIGEFTTRYLYRNVFIRRPKQLVCLFRTFHERPNLRRYTRLFVNLVPLLYPQLQRGVEKYMEKSFPDLEGIHLAYPTTISAPEMQTIPGSSEQQLVKPLWVDAIIRTLLDMLPNLEDVLTSVVFHRNGMPTAIPADQGLFETKPSFSSSLHTGQKPRPRTLRIRMEKEYFKTRYTSEERGGPLLPLYFPPYVTRGCRVTDLTFLTRADIAHYEVAKATHCVLPALERRSELSPNDAGDLYSIAWLGQLQSLSLIDCSVDPLIIAQLLSRCGNLRSLVWDANMDGMWSKSADFKKALETVSEHLECLAMLVPTMSVGFPSFEALRSLTVRFTFVHRVIEWAYFPPREASDADIRKKCLASVLPKSIETLRIIGGTGLLRHEIYRDSWKTLRPAPGHRANEREIFKPWFVEYLLTFAERHCKGNLPRLREVIYAQPMELTEMKFERESYIRVETLELTPAFEKVGVHFVLELQ